MKIEAKQRLTAGEYRQRTYEIVESKQWQAHDGRTASPYGSAPWTSDEDKKNWKLVTRGFTVRNKKDGTVGIGKQPWKTHAEAQAWLNEGP